MKSPAILSLSAWLWVCLPLCAADAHMTAEERAKVLNWLEESLIHGPLHTMRHDNQIAEVKATAGYPK